MLYYEELFTRSQCSNCRQEISGLGVECGECHGGGFRLCSECFAVGAEIGQHKKEHRYRFFDSGSLALFPASATEIASTKENNGSSLNPRWSAREEIRLLDAIEQYGFGNWQDISKHIESRGPTDTKKEFVERYVTGNIGQVTWADRNNNADETVLELKRSIGVFPQPIDHTIPCDDGPLSPSLTQRLPPLNISADEMLQLGYMPFRDDYEKEYDNEAEKLVSQLTFSPDDDEVDIGLKLALVDMYSRRLRERARRKRVIRDYQLVSKFFKKDRAKAANSVELNGAKDNSKRFQGAEKKLQEKLRPFAQFYKCREFDNMISNIVEEKNLKLRLQELYKYRAAGITSLEDCVDFERTRPVLGKRGRPGAALGTVDEENDEGRSRRKAMTPNLALTQQLQPPSQIQGSPNPKISPMASGEGAGGNAGYAAQNLTPQPFSKDDFCSRNSESSASELALLPQLLDGMDQEHQDPLEENSFLLSGGQKVTDALYTANFIPGADLLTRNELNVCQNTNILPHQFLTIKLGFVLGRLKPNNQDTDRVDENSLVCPPDMQRGEWNQILQFFFSKDDTTNESAVDMEVC